MTLLLFLPFQRYLTDSFLRFLSRLYICSCSVLTEICWHCPIEGDRKKMPMTERTSCFHIYVQQGKNKKEFHMQSATLFIFGMCGWRQQLLSSAILQDAWVILPEFWKRQSGTDSWPGLYAESLHFWEMLNNSKWIPNNKKYIFFFLVLRRTLRIQ